MARSEFSAGPDAAPDRSVIDVLTSLGYDPAPMGHGPSAEQVAKIAKILGCEASLTAVAEALQLQPIDLGEAASRLGLAETYVRKLAGDGTFVEPAGKLGATRWWWPHDIEALAEQRRTPGA